MSVCRLRLIVLPLAVIALVVAPTATAGRDAGLAALQVALHSRGLYFGAIDGVKGPGTTAAIKRFQRRAGLTPDGIAGAQTRKALGRYGRHILGSRPLTRGASGWDVAALQFLLAWHGFPSATIDGGLGEHTERALRHFQRWAGLEPDGVAGATTYAALRRAPASCPVALAWPVNGPIGDPFGPRGNRFHAGDRHPRGHRHAGCSRRRRPRHLRGLARREAGGTWSWSPMPMACGRCTPTSLRLPFGSASASAPATASARSVRPATRPGRTCTSRSGCAAPRSIRRAPCRNADSGGTLGAWRRSAT